MKINQIFSILFCILCLSACTGDRCIDSDDFGFQKFTVSSRYKPEELSSQVQGNQVAPWVNSGYRVNGRPLTMIVKTWKYGEDKNRASELSAWGPWYGMDTNFNTLSKFCERLQECTFIDGKMCTSTKDARIGNAPCLFKNGVGLYALIARRGTDPNLSFASQRSPEGITFHLGEPTSGYGLYDVSQTGKTRKAGGIVYKYQGSGNQKQEYADSQLFFKILDKFYDDNNGQYRVVIKSGISDNRPDPIQFLTLLVKNNLFGTSGTSYGLDRKSYSDISKSLKQNDPTLNVYDNGNKKEYGLIRNIYLNIIKNPGYRLAVAAMLSLYIMFTALSFLAGNINITHTELIVRVVKFSIVSALLSAEYGWSFFNNYLFVYFVGGVEQILQIIQEAGASGPGSSSLIGLMTAPQTMAKLWSLLFIDWRGFIYIILFLIALYFVIMMMFEAAVIYLTALIAIGMIITMGPIFICFLLFQVTRSLFENWLKQLISYALQPIILFTGLAFISMIIRAELYSSLGFRVCKYDFPNLGPIGDLFGSFTESLDLSIGNSIFYWWFPEPGEWPSPRPDQVPIPVPQDYEKDDGTFCEAYACVEKRYVDLPFLDPIKDEDRISNFFQGNFVQFDGLLLIFVAVYLLQKFNGISVSVAKFLSNTSGNLTNVQSVGHESAKGVGEMVKSTGKFVGDKVEGALRKIPAVNKAFDTASKAAKAVKGIPDMASNAAAGWYENKQKARLANKALDPKSANAAVLAEVKKTTGMEQKDVVAFADAPQKYKEALQKQMTEINNGLTEGKLSKEALDEKIKTLANKSFNDVNNDVAGLKFKGKKYNELNQDQKAEVDKLLKPEKGESLRTLSANAKATEDFKKAYVNAHQEMSKRGVGLIGKRFSALRSMQELNNRIEEREKLKTAKRRSIGEKLYSGYEGLKRDAMAAVVGKDRVGEVGAVWHDFDLNDPRLRTYNESLRDQERETEYKELKMQLDKATISAGDDVLRPEYLAKLEASGNTELLNHYQELSRKKLEYDVRNKLAEEGQNGESPVLMGEKFMREKATDSQSRDMINRAYEIRQELIDNDRYIRKEDYYEAMNEKAAESIQKVYQEKYDLLKDHYKRDDIKPEELPMLLEKYYNQDITVDVHKAKKEVEDLKKTVNEFSYSNQILEKIEERKAQIAEEITKHVDGINQQRKESNMPEYKPKNAEEEIPTTRKLRSIDDWRKK
ncbi:type IV secretion system protein [Candidatus Trichorickettsia mobilis]|nr:type IV secretion system protein [Candidatus Trichorickettsia mobilis]